MKYAPEGVEMFACELDGRLESDTRLGLPPERFVRGNALTDLTAWMERFDLVIGNPPFSAQWNLENRSSVLETFDLGRKRKCQCLAGLFVELFVKLTKPGGADSHHFTRRPAGQSPLLDELRRPDLSHDGGWVRVDLSEADDWRPEAHACLPAQHQGWVPLGSVAEIRTGAAKYGELRKLFSEPASVRILLVLAKNLAPSGGLKVGANHENVAFISRDGPMFRESAVVVPGEILFVRVGAGCYGRAALVPPGLEAQADGWIHVITLRPGFDTEGLTLWLNSEEGRTRVKRLAKGVGTVSISKSALLDLLVPVSFSMD